MSDMHLYIDMMLKSNNKISVSSDSTRIYIDVHNFVNECRITAMFDRKTGDFIQYITK